MLRADLRCLRGHLGSVAKGLAALLAAAVLGACGAPGPTLRPALRISPGDDLYAARQARFLAIAHRQMQGLAQRGEADGGRWAAGALVAAALAARGEATEDEAARWADMALQACGGRWPTQRCQHAQLTIQRLALQFPEALPGRPALQARLRAAAAEGPAPLPTPDEIATPWSFRETENQRIVATARSLVAEAAAGTPDSPAARAWGAYAAAFLAAHERDGWYEQESAGYMAASIVALLHLADLAPRPEVRLLAARQLTLLFAGWAQEQVGGYPAGPRSRTYVQWALGATTTAWPAWAWFAGGFGRPEEILLIDAPELAVAGYRIPEPIRRLAAERRRQPPYAVVARRTIALPNRRRLDAALYSYATPDYVLGTAQSVGGLRLGVSGGQEILATLYAEAAPGQDAAVFAPLYLWSRTRNPHFDRWKTWAEQDFAVGRENLALARLGAGGESTGHAYLAPGWTAPEPAGAAVVSRYGDTYVALVTVGGAEGGWEVARAARRFPAYYGGDPAFRDAWAVVPWRQPADVALEVGRRADVGSFASWKRRAARASLAVDASGVLRFRSSAGVRLAFLPGAWASAGASEDAGEDAGEKKLRPEQYPRLAGPYLASREPGRWSFAYGGVRLGFDRVAFDRLATDLAGDRAP